MSRILPIACLMLMGWIVDARSAETNNCRVEILIGGQPIPEFTYVGVSYVEALKGREYTIRLTNPFGVRVAVALSVDGLNTIDARHTEAYMGKKWVIGPFESITIYGWQTSSMHARRFFFTTEEHSYGNWLNRKDNLGIISAVFFREQSLWSSEPLQLSPPTTEFGPSLTEQLNKGTRSADAPTTGEVSTNPEKDEYAATGIGRNRHNQIRWISMELESKPVATVSVRYEFRPILTKLGILPQAPNETTIYRRQHAKGFMDADYCPDPF